MYMNAKRFLVIGAHADDCENVGGIAWKLLQRGHAVKFLVLTNGCSGHQTEMGGGIAVRRQEEAQAVSRLFGMEYEVLDNPDGALTTELGYREQVIRAIRSYRPDFIFTHRPCDYHPDHRAASMLVQDAAFLVTVPNVCPLTPVLRYMPAMFYMPDSFQKPYPFEPTRVFDISDVIDEKIRMYHQYASQMYEWLPWVGQIRDGNVPTDEQERLSWLKREHGHSFAAYAERWRDRLIEKYGEQGRRATYAEAIEACEYGAMPDDRTLDEIFDF